MQNRHNRAFTLIELLVVVAIVIVLAALSIMASGKMIQAAKVTTCSSNLRQISPVVHMLREEGVGTSQTPSGCFPPYAGQISVPSWGGAFNIYELIGTEAGLCEFSSNDYEWTVHPSETFLQNPLSEHKLGGNQAFTDIRHKNFDIAGGFSYNHRIEGWVSKNSPQVEQTRILDVKYPEFVILMAEQNVANTIWMGPYNDRTPQGNYMESAHCLFVDGHIELLKNDYLASQEARNKHYIPNGNKIQF